MQNSIPNDYSTSAGSQTSIHATNRRTTNENHVVSHYETAHDLMEGEAEAEYDYEHEEEYWEPASQEAELKAQLYCLNIIEITSNDLEYVIIPYRYYTIIAFNGLATFLFTTLHRLKSEIGSGQFATVHRGLWMKTKDVAVKTLKGDVCEDTKIQFLREAAIMGQFDHPNVLHILAFGYNDNMKVRQIILIW